MMDNEPSQRLTMSLIERCIGGSGTGGAEERASDLLKVEVLRLDWQRIPSIQNLDIFTNLRELYLQHNRIQVIEDLDTLRSLEFLALGSNHIRRFENLRHLSKVLDLSENMIEDVDTQELPHALVIVNLAGNPCCREPSFRQRITCTLPDLKVLDGEQVEVLSHPAGVEECKGPMEGGNFSLRGDQPGGEHDQAILYVTVHSGGDSKVVPFRFSPRRHIAHVMQATRFCAENGLYGDSTRDVLIDHMEEATAGPAQAPESEEIGTEDATQERTDHDDPPEVDQRLHAILHLQKTRARVMQESTASFEQHKKTLLSATRKLVERKTASAHGRSGALEEDINKILNEARAELQLRRARVSTENRQFATDMREKIERVLAERRRETEAAAEGTGVEVSSKEKV